MLHLLSQPRVTEDPSPWLLLGAGAVVAALVLILIWPRLRGGRDGNASRTARTPADPSLAQQRAVERDMQTLAHELSDMARKVGAQLDARAARLEALIREADERLTRLGSLTGARPDEHSNGHPPPPAPPPSVAGAPEQEIDPRHAQVYALMDEGLSAYQIADRLGRPEGEVELIIALRPRGRAAI